MDIATGIDSTSYDDVKEREEIEAAERKLKKMIEDATLRKNAAIQERERKIAAARFNISSSFSSFTLKNGTCAPPLVDYLQENLKQNYDLKKSTDKEEEQKKKKDDEIQSPSSLSLSSSSPPSLSSSRHSSLPLLQTQSTPLSPLSQTLYSLSLLPSPQVPPPPFPLVAPPSLGVEHTIPSSSVRECNDNHLVSVQHYTSSSSSSSSSAADATRSREDIEIPLRTPTFETFPAFVPLPSLSYSLKQVQLQSRDVMKHQKKETNTVNSSSSSLSAFSGSSSSQPQPQPLLHSPDVTRGYFATPLSEPRKEQGGANVRKRTRSFTPPPPKREQVAKTHREERKRRFSPDPPSVVKMPGTTVNNNAPAYKAWVRDLPPECSSHELRQFFERFGTVISTNIPLTKERKYGFVVFAEESSRQRVIGATLQLRPTHHISCDLPKQDIKKIGSRDGDGGSSSSSSSTTPNSIDRAIIEKAAVFKFSRLQIMYVQDIRRQQAIDRGDPMSSTPSENETYLFPCWNFQYSLLGCKSFGMQAGFWLRL